MEPKQLLDAVKNSIIEGKNHIQKLIETEEASRSSTLLPNTLLEKLQKLAVMNSLCATQAQMYGKDAVISINLAGSLAILPAISVTKKQQKK